MSDSNDAWSYIRGTFGEEAFEAAVKAFIKAKDEVIATLREENEKLKGLTCVLEVANRDLSCIKAQYDRLSERAEKLIPEGYGVAGHTYVGIAFDYLEEARDRLTEEKRRLEDVDAEKIQDLALAAGLIVSVLGGYDPAKHGEDEYCDLGDEYYELAEWLKEGI